MPWQAYHTVWALLVFGWIGNYMVRMAFSPLLGPVMTEFGLSHAEGGFLFSVFFYGYVAMQIPAGLLGDRFGRKRVLVVGILLVAASALMTGLARTLVVVGLARLVTGLAQGMYFANDRPIIAAATPRERLAGGGLVSGLGSATRRRHRGRRAGDHAVARRLRSSWRCRSFDRSLALRPESDGRPPGSAPADAGTASAPCSGTTMWAWPRHGAHWTRGSRDWDRLSRGGVEAGRSALRQPLVPLQGFAMRLSAPCSRRSVGERRWSRARPHGASTVAMGLRCSTRPAWLAGPSSTSFHWGAGRPPAPSWPGVSAGDGTLRLQRHAFVSAARAVLTGWIKDGPARSPGVHLAASSGWPVPVAMAVRPPSAGASPLAPPGIRARRYNTRADASSRRPARHLSPLATALPARAAGVARPRSTTASGSSSSRTTGARSSPPRSGTGSARGTSAPGSPASPTTSST
jgi:hypothetical protein